MSFRFIDLYAGIGGMRLGFESAGGVCVYTSESDKYCRETYTANFGRGAIADRTPETEAERRLIPPFEVLCAGFPCQPFSGASRAVGGPDGFDHEISGNAFDHIANIIDARQPKAFALENVPYILRHDEMRTIGRIMDVLSFELRYQVIPILVDSSSWVPQERKRLFLVGFREWVMFNPQMLLRPNQDPTLDSILEDSPDPKYELSDAVWRTVQERHRRNKEAGNDFSYRLCGPKDKARTLLACHPSRRNTNIIKQGDGKNPRFLTPRECARLMGFPDTFKFPVSDNQAYKQIGNAVVVPAVAALAEIMEPHILTTAYPHTHIPRGQVHGTQENTPEYPNHRHRALREGPGSGRQHSVC